MLYSKLLLAALWCVPLLAFASIPSGLQVVGKGEARYLGVIKVYDAELAVSESATRASVLNPEVSRCLKLHYAVDLTKDKFVLAADTVLKRQHAAETLAKVQAQVEQLHAAYADVKAGDVYQLCYDAQQQTTTLLLNAKTVVSVPSAEFAQVYFGIWLGEQRPIAQELREGLLQGL